MTQLKARIAAKRIEALDICSFELVPVANVNFPAFEAGAHIDLHLPGLPVRQYSLCNAPSDAQRYQLAILREPQSRGFSRRMHDDVQIGDVIEISSPKNHFALASAMDEAVLIAGGIGVTPILAMAEALHDAGVPFTLHYCTRSPERAAFVDRLRAADWADRVSLYFDDDQANRRLDLSALLAHRSPGKHLYFCGPSGFLDWIKTAAAAQGWPADQVHCEYFSGTVETRDSDQAFEIEIAETGQIITVAKGQTALSAMVAAGIDVPCSCEEGVCGMCMTPVKEGTPDHRDQFLTEAERARGDVFMPCCSRSVSARLVVAPDY
ncbi:MAG: PDR/VanB family oxidoreductase [Gemmobacter sp.]|nr:PDR/VanB family oxidoreductase [Gemmobacter sp.]